MFKDRIYAYGRTIWSYKNKYGKNVVGLAKIDGFKYLFYQYGRMLAEIKNDYKSNKIYCTESNRVLSNYKD